MVVARATVGLDERGAGRSLDPGVRAAATHDCELFEGDPAHSLRLIDTAAPAADAALIDVGGGASLLAAQLVKRGATDVTVVDISPTALEQARGRAGPAAEQITYLEIDVLDGLDRSYDLWHDRAVLHFMVDDESREAYLATLRAAVRGGGHVVLATFGPDGPRSCSGLPVARYSAGELAAVLGGGFALVEDFTTSHNTPSGTHQQFTYALFRRIA